jgi:predicted transcriptional regulator
MAEVSDPRALRALASPSRLALLDYLREHGAGTASRCAEVVGESVQLCSYHLRELASPHQL